MSDEDSGQTTEQQEVSTEEEKAAVERTRANIIGDFAKTLGSYNQRVVTSFNAALGNFETTVRSASAQEANADILRVMATTAFEEGAKAAIKELGEAAPAVGVIFSFGKAIKQEIDRAAAAATSHEVGNWIKDLRSAANDAYTNSGNEQSLMNVASEAYSNL